MTTSLRTSRVRSRSACLSVLAACAVACAVVACGRATPAADSTATASVPAADSATTPPVAAPLPAAVASTETVAAPHALAPAPTPRPRLVPRPPHPVPRPMPPRSDPQLASAPGGGDQASDEAAIERLKREAHALAHIDGCTAADQCGVMPIGARACGGPSDYVLYCPKSTNVAALTRKAAEIARAEKAFNEKYQLMSTCELRAPPAAQLVGGSCKAAAAPTGPSPR